MKALVLAGSIPQIELLRQLRERNITTVLADGNSNCLARPYADIFYQVQIFDAQAVADVAVKEKVDFVITVCADQVLLIMAQVSEMLGLPCYIDYQTAQNVSDKIKMKRIFRDNGIPTSRFVELTELDYQAVGQLRYPMVVKPIDAYSSRGVRRVENRDELEVFYKEAAEISRGGGVIIEEYCPGEEISVDAFIRDGKAQILCVSNSYKILDDGRFVIYRGMVPVSASPEILRQIETVAQQIADAFGLRNAPLLIQMINDGKQVYVLEFCARTGGNMKWLLIKYSCGVDVISAAIDLSLGIQPELKKCDTGHKIVVNDFLYGRPGVFDHLEGFAEAKEAGLINDYYAIRPSGFVAYGVRSSSDRIAGINIVADSEAEFNEKLRKANGMLRIMDKEGNDIMRHDLIRDIRPLSE